MLVIAVSFNTISIHIIILILLFFLSHFSDPLHQFSPHHFHCHYPGSDPTFISHESENTLQLIFLLLGSLLLSPASLCSKSLKQFCRNYQMKFKFCSLLLKALHIWFSIYPLLNINLMTTLHILCILLTQKDIFSRLFI